MYIFPSWKRFQVGLDYDCTKSTKIHGSGGIRTHASEETGALNQRLRPLGHATSLPAVSRNRTTHGHSPGTRWLLRNFRGHTTKCLYSSVAERWSCKPKVMSSILIGGRSTCFAQDCHFRVDAKKIFDPDVIRTRSLLIWSQTRYRCATESISVRFYRDLNSDRWIQSPEC